MEPKLAVRYICDCTHCSKYCTGYFQIPQVSFPSQYDLPLLCDVRYITHYNRLYIEASAQKFLTKIY